ncbi:Serine/threonine-protein kinase PRP4 [Phytophthora pseudosyringae]|uniref:non-specific serine/threonine protein kinase n=1 Tax=Phytophthora pseudosyringae TaxID=221518 RepID=A0A8T1VW07_9STRA|nr:Serine/threonine-protein kinase PRP4 [Phytophthora pseudosyringae]
MAASSPDRSADRCARRPHRSRSRSLSASRSRRSSRRRSSKRRSASRSRSRERSRRTSRHSHRRHRSRSLSRSSERHKRRRHDSDERRGRRRSRSRSKPKSASRAQEKRQDDKKQDDKAATAPSSAASSQDSTAEKAAAGADKKEVAGGEDVPMKGVSEPQQSAQLAPAMAKVAVHESKELGDVEDEKQANNVVSVESVAKQGLKTEAKPALDVSSIKAGIVKALADARNTIAVIKKSGASSSVATTPTSAPQNEKEKEEEDAPVESPKMEQTEMGKSPSPLKTVTSPTKTVAATTVPDEFDMFSMAALDDHDDAMNGSAGVAAIMVNEVSLQSNCDDAEGYYSTTIGEMLNGNYRVLGAVGKGVFSTVLRCQCITPLKIASGNSLDVVAVKLIRNNDVMRDAAQTELKLLHELGERDLRDKKHCIRLLDSFTHRNHVAMVFEPMQMNVREAMKKFGGKGGISIQAVHVFSKHLLVALNHLESCGVIHADIKPDNMLLDEKQTTIKLCDFGSAFKADNGKQDPTPYLVSRFYRAPEIVLGLAYDKAVDMWSVGCCLYEMFTGKVMFPGSTNNEMLKFFMELKGKIPNKLIKKHRQAYIDQFEMEPHFTEDLKFCSRESDRVTGKPILRLMDTIKTKSDLAGSLMAAKSATDDRKQVLELRGLLDRMFTLDPSKRISVRDALAHPFVKG